MNIEMKETVLPEKIKDISGAQEYRIDRISANLIQRYGTMVNVFCL